nr:Cap [Po-Circo-like virus]
MFDPHRTRRSNSRYFTRKGQVLQASRVNVNPVIDQRLVPIYKNYLINNGLAYDIPQNNTIQIDAIRFSLYEAPETYFGSALADMQVSVNTNLTISGNTTQNNQYIVVLYKGTDGVIHLWFKGFAQANQPYSITISNNEKCYYSLFNVSSAFIGHNIEMNKTLLSNGKAIIQYASHSEGNGDLYISSELPINI